jgi:sugar lactone lactonase YvrE
MDPSGSIFIAESNRRIRKANAGVNAQVGTYSQFSSNMDGIAIDNNGTLFVADYDHKIQKIDQHGNRTVFVGDTSGSADGVGTAMRLNTPRGIVIDNYDNLFVMDTNNGSIRKVTKGRVGTTIVGPTGASAGERGHVDGTGTSVRFNYPNHPFVDSENNIYIADSDNYRIRKMTPQGLVTTVAGSGPVGAFDGIGTNSGFSHMWGLYLDKFNNILVSDDSTIRKINMDNFVVVTFAGTGSRGNGDGFLRNAQFNQPCGLTGDNDGNIYITEYGNGLVRRISPTGQVTWFAGGGSGANIDGIGTNARFSEPIDVSFDSANSCLYVSDRGNQRIRVIKVIPQRTISFANNPITGTINMPNGQINFTGLLNFR